MAATFRRKQALTVAEAPAVLRVRKWPTGADQSLGSLGFTRQAGQLNRLDLRRLRNGTVAKDCGTCQNDSEPQLAKGWPPRLPTEEKHGLSLKYETVMVSNQVKNLKSLPQFRAGTGDR
jgi:hypothetical protein